MLNPFLKVEWLKEGRNVRLPMIIIFYNAILAFITILFMFFNAESLQEGYSYNTSSYLYQFLIISTFQIGMIFVLMPFSVWGFYATDREKDRQEEFASVHQEFETEWINEPMRHILGGIFIRTFRLFAGEKIEYYISEQDENGEKTGEKHLLQREEAMDAWPETGVELLNRMNHAIQTEDSQAVNEMICSYERINEMTEQLFELK